MPRVTSLIAIVAAMALCFGVGTANAHKRKTQRNTTILFQDLPGSTGDRIYGQLALGAAPEEPFSLAMPAAGGGNCLSGQKIEIEHNLTVGDGGGPAGPRTLVATAVTDATGAWETTAYEASGANQLLFDTFFAEAVKVRLKPKNDRHKHVCIGAFANKTVFSP